MPLVREVVLAMPVSAVVLDGEALYPRRPWTTPDGSSRR